MNKEQALEWLKCADERDYFINTYVKIKDPLHGIIPFRLHPFQIDTLHKFDTKRKVIILKSRQMGISWLCCADVLHEALFSAAHWILIISKREQDAYDLMERIQFMFKYLPAWMKPKITGWNKGMIAFDNDSKIESQPTTKDAGRGRPPSRLIVDEYAFCRYDADLLNSAETALSHGGRAVLLSTANGYGNEFARVWMGAVRKENNFYPHFLAWFAYPGRTAEWLAEETKGWQSWRVFQEYPGTWEEAFRQTGRPVFDYDSLALTASSVKAFDLSDEEEAYKFLDLDKIEKAPMFFARDKDEEGNVEEVEGTQHMLLRYRHCLFIYQRPELETSYLIGADVAEGLVHGDNSSVTVINRTTGEEVASWYGKLKPHEFAALLHELAQLYPGLLLPERNNHGQTVCNLLEMWHSPHLHFSKPVWDRQSGKKIKDRKSGWETTAGNKTVMIDELAMALKLCHYRPASPFFLREAEKYETQDDGRYSAPEGFTDDAVMSTAIAWAGRRFLVIFEGMSSGHIRDSIKQEGV